MAQELELFNSTITPSCKWIKKEVKWLVPEEFSFLLSGMHIFNQVGCLDGEDDIRVSMRMRAIRDLTYFRSLIIAKIYRSGHMGIEEKKANYILAGRASFYIKQSYVYFDKGSSLYLECLTQLTDMLPDYEKVTGLSMINVEAGLFPKYE